MKFEQNGLLIDRHYIKAGSTIGETELYLKMQPINLLTEELIDYYSNNKDYIFYLQDDGTLTTLGKDFSECVNKNNVILGTDDVYIPFNGNLDTTGPVTLTAHGDINYVDYNGRKVWNIDNHQYISTNLDSKKYKTLMCVARSTTTDTWNTIWRNDNIQIGNTGKKYGVWESGGSPSNEYTAGNIDDNYHVYVFTIDENQQIKYYVDGNKIIDEKTNNWWDKYTGNLIIGRWAGDNQDWHGQIYNMMFLKKTLSESEVSYFKYDVNILSLKPEYKNRLFFRKTPKVSFATSKSHILNPIDKEFPITSFSDDGTEIQIKDDNPKIYLFDKKIKYRNNEFRTLTLYYPEKDFLLIKNGEKIQYATDPIDTKASSLGLVLFCPHSKEDYRLAMSWLSRKGHSYSDVGPLGIYYPENGPGCCNWGMRYHALKSDDIGKLGWKVVDGSDKWWASDRTNVSEPNGDYSAKGFLNFSFDGDGNLRNWNDAGACSYTTYLCVPKNREIRYILDGSVKLNNPHTDIVFDSYHRTSYNSEYKFTYILDTSNIIYKYIKDDDAIEIDDDINGAFIFIHNNLYRVIKSEKLDNGHYKAYLKFKFALLRIKFKSHFKPMLYKKSELVDPINFIYKYTYEANIPRLTDNKYLFRRIEADDAVVLPPFTTYIGN